MHESLSYHDLYAQLATLRLFFSIESAVKYWHFPSFAIWKLRIAAKPRNLPKFFSLKSFRLYDT